MQFKKGTRSLKRPVQTKLTTNRLKKFKNLLKNNNKTNHQMLNIKNRKKMKL